MNNYCNVCGSKFQLALFESAENASITTMNKIIPGRTRVYFCDDCGHLQTNELSNLKDYYAYEYQINADGDDEDQLYKIIDNKPVFRAEHQAAVLTSKLDFFPGCRVIDYGCAKAPTLKTIVEKNPTITPFLFDVTDRYVPYWQKYPKAAEWAVHQAPREWQGTMDIVLSFYALEHVSDLSASLADISALLKPGGFFYFIVPNVYQNIADFIVADHINHFSPTSLDKMLNAAGFSDIVIDSQAHDAAFVVSARRRLMDSAGRNDGKDATLEISEYRDKALAMAQYWNNLTTRIRDFERSLPPSATAAIYGAGFYGSLIFSSLKNAEAIQCFIDRNPHLQARTLHGRPVFSPEHIPESIGHIYIGLNPRTAQASVGEIKAWQGKLLDFFYL